MEEIRRILDSTDLVQFSSRMQTCSFNIRKMISI